MAGWLMPMESAMVDPKILDWLESFSHPCSLLVCSRGAAKAKVFGQAHKGRIGIAEISLQGVSELKLRTAADSILLVFHRSGHLEGRIERQPITRLHGCLQGVAMPLEGMDLRVESPSATITLMQINQVLLDLAMKLHSEQECSADQLFKAIRGFELALLPMLDGFTRACDGSNTSENLPIALQRLEVSIISLIVRLMPLQEQRHQEAGPSGGRKGWVEAAEKVMRSRMAKRLNLRSLAEACGCSERTLQLAFQRELDCTPMERLRELRLGAMHAILTKGGSVREACHGAGLALSGRTAQHYKDKYGKLPIDDRRRADDLVAPRQSRNDKHP